MTDQTPQTTTERQIAMLTVPRSAVERLILAADNYGAAHLDSDDMDDDATELQDATEVMKDHLATPQPLAIGLDREAVARIIDGSIHVGVMAKDASPEHNRKRRRALTKADAILALAAPAVSIHGISLRGQQGEPAGMMTVTAHLSDGREVVLIEDNGNVISHWKNVRELPAAPTGGRS